MASTRVSALTLATIVLSLQAHAYDITDFGAVRYEGYNGRGHADIVGAASTFEIYGANVQRTRAAGGVWLSVDIYTNFAGRGDDRLFASSTASAPHAPARNKGIGYGDLFLGDEEWLPFGTAPYNNDYHANGTHWQFAFALDNRWWDGSNSDNNANSGGAGTLYRLNGAANDDNARVSNEFFNCTPGAPGCGVVYRDGQEVAVDTANATALRAGVWTITSQGGADDQNDYLRFLIDVTGTTLATSEYVALHWGMTCANDVIEGGVELPVPEPATLSLFAVALLGSWPARCRLARYRRS